MCGSGAEQGLDGAAFVHGPVALGRLGQRQGEVEYLTRVDGPVFDAADQLGQEAANRRGTAVQVDLGVEQFLAGAVLVEALTTTRQPAIPRAREVALSLVMTEPPSPAAARVP